MILTTPTGPAEVVAVEIKRETVAKNQYHLVDGTVLTLQTVVTGVFRHVEADQYGQPQYAVQSQTVMSFVPADHGASSPAEN